MTPRYTSISPLLRTKYDPASTHKVDKKYCQSKVKFKLHNNVTFTYDIDLFPDTLPDKNIKPAFDSSKQPTKGILKKESDRTSPLFLKREPKAKAPILGERANEFHNSKPKHSMHSHSHCEKKRLMRYSRYPSVRSYSTQSVYDEHVNLFRGPIPTTTRNQLSLFNPKRTANKLINGHRASPSYSRT